MATLAVQQITLVGLNPTFAAASAGGDKLAGGPTTLLHVKNGGVGTITVTIDSVVLSNFGTDVNITVNVPAAGEREIGPLVEQRFASPVDGLVAVTYTGVTDVTVAAKRI
jgi:hypothetical protein